MADGEAAFDPKQSREQEYRQGPGRAVRPRDASTLIIVRRDGAAPQLLMGQRHANHKFMPNKFVFPGGRVDRADSRIRPLEDLRPEVERLVLDRIRGVPSANRARALALAAIRETFEETGLAIGKLAPARQRSRHADWNAYFATGISPALDTLDLIARAVTPAYRTRRFDTRFFMADAEHIHGDPSSLSGSGELQGLHWVRIEDALALDLPNITRMVIKEIGERLALSSSRQRVRPVPFLLVRHGKMVREILGS